jgi:hypothetical protein
MLRPRSGMAQHSVVIAVAGGRSLRDGEIACPCNRRDRAIYRLLVLSPFKIINLWPSMP